jgi:REP element-mobilizing transposase RayT
MEPLQPGLFYHIYNRGNNRENLFVEERNYDYFIKLYVRHIEPAADTYAYCLLRNHFHLLVRVKDNPDQTELGRPIRSIPPSKSFSNFFNAYARAFNITNQRTGTLFQRPFQRKVISSDAYLLQAIAYIHQNSQKHGMIADFRNWRYSSYYALTHPAAPTRLKRTETLELFGGVQGFVEYHFIQTELSDIEDDSEETSEET